MNEKITAKSVKADMPEIERVAVGFWQVVLDGALEDGRDYGIAESIIIQSMMHHALCEYAKLNGYAATARELYGVALKFFKGAGMEKGANAQSSTSRQ